MISAKNFLAIFGILLFGMVLLNTVGLNSKVHLLEAQVATLSAVTPEPTEVIQAPVAVSTPNLSIYTTEDRVGTMVATALGQMDYATKSDIETLTNDLALLEDQVASTGGDLYWLRQELQMTEGYPTHIGALIWLIAGSLDLSSWSSPCNPVEDQLQIVTMYGGAVLGSNQCHDAITGGDSTYTLEPYTQGNAYVTLVRETA